MSAIALYWYDHLVTQLTGLQWIDSFFSIWIVEWCIVYLEQSRVCILSRIISWSDASESALIETWTVSAIFPGEIAHTWRSWALSTPSILFISSYISDMLKWFGVPIRRVTKRGNMCNMSYFPSIWRKYLDLWKWSKLSQSQKTVMCKADPRFSNFRYTIWEPTLRERRLIGLNHQWHV